MANWLIGYEKLDPEQRGFIDNQVFRNNTWINGFPGSGKSILIAHSINRIRQSNPNATIAVVLFTRALIEMFNKAFEELRISGVNCMTMYEFNKGSNRYDYVFCDEVQDIPDSFIRSMKNRAGHVIVAGDPNQSIYDSDPQRHEPTVDPDNITSLISGTEYKLSTIHRLTRSIISSIGKLISGIRNLLSAKNDAMKKDVSIRIGKAQSESKEVEWVLNEAMDYVDAGMSVGILLPSQQSALRFCQAVLSQKGISEWKEETNCWGKTDFGILNRYLSSNKVKLQYVGNGVGSFCSRGKAFVMTYHSSKGIDFDSVFLPYLNTGMSASRNPEIDRRVFMVAVTRTRENLFISYTGTPHEYLRCFDGNKTDIEIGKTASTSGGWDF